MKFKFRFTQKEYWTNFFVHLYLKKLKNRVLIFNMRYFYFFGCPLCFPRCRSAIVSRHLLEYLIVLCFDISWLMLCDTFPAEMMEVGCRLSFHIGQRQSGGWVSQFLSRYFFQYWVLQCFMEWIVIQIVHVLMSVRHNFPMSSDLALTAESQMFLLYCRLALIQNYYYDQQVRRRTDPVKSSLVIWQHLRVGHFNFPTENMDDQ